MRPRHEASEIKRSSGCSAGLTSASMRPRHEASEIRSGPFACGGRCLASMRPRHEASEINAAIGARSLNTHRFNEAEARGLGNLHLAKRARAGQRRFNEAEARGLGNRRGRAGSTHRQHASMRPRHEASEIRRNTSRCGSPGAGFNEAEARGLGNHCMGHDDIVSVTLLQ